MSERMWSVVFLGEWCGTDGHHEVIRLSKDEAMSFADMVKKKGAILVSITSRPMPHVKPISQEEFDQMTGKSFASDRIQEDRHDK